MSGHSKWSTIKRQKGVADARRGALFTKLGREISVAAREGGGDPAANFKLRLIIDKAKAANMPKENIERAIKRGTGELKGEAEFEITYEGYGPNGVAVLVKVLTDNRNRAAAEVRRVFTRHGGSLGETGCVAWMFEPKGYLSVKVNDGQDPDEIAMAAIDAGADDVIPSDDTVEVYTKVEDFQWVREALEKRGYELEEQEPIWMTPKTLMRLGEKETLQAMSLIDALEELEDVSKVFTNLDIPDEVMEKYQAA
ncbi:MAG: YebC/PmpR family DNA-binding transcriptional regulator [Anaerolineales bacterium]